MDSENTEMSAANTEPSQETQSEHTSEGGQSGWVPQPQAFLGFLHLERCESYPYYYIPFYSPEGHVCPSRVASTDPHVSDPSPPVQPNCAPSTEINVHANEFIPANPSYQYASWYPQSIPNEPIEESYVPEGFAPSTEAYAQPNVNNITYYENQYAYRSICDPDGQNFAQKPQINNKYQWRSNEFYRDSNESDYIYEINSNQYEFFTSLHGTAVLCSLENDTNITIQVLNGLKSKRLVITGSNDGDIAVARHKIESLIRQTKCRSPFTHTISVPCNTEDIKTNYLNFKKDVMDRTNGAIGENLFTNPECLQVTLAVLSAVNSNGFMKINDIYAKCREDIFTPLLKDNPLTLELRGIEILRGNIHRARVVGINVHDQSGRLQLIKDKITEYFVNHGLASKPQDGCYKLQVLAMNTRYTKTQSSRFECFDTSKFYEEYKDKEFGKMTLSAINLSLKRSRSNEGIRKLVSAIYL